MLTQATRRPRGCSNQAASAQLAQLHATASSRRQRRQPPQAAARAPRRQRCHTRRGEHAGAHESTARNIMHTCTSHTTFDGEHGRFCATAVEEKQRCVFSAPLAASDLRHSWGPSWTELHRLVTWPPQAPPEPGRRRPVSANHRLFARHRTVNRRGERLEAQHLPYTNNTCSSSRNQKSGGPACAIGVGGGERSGVSVEARSITFTMEGEQHGRRTERRVAGRNARPPSSSAACGASPKAHAASI